MVQIDAKHEQLIWALLNSDTKEEAARKSGTPRNTMYRWLRDPAFQEALRKAGRAAFDEAWTWIFTRGIGCPLAFENVCDALGINCDALRWRLKALMSGAHDSTRVAPLRLRLKEASRVQRLTVNRIRRRHKRHFPTRRAR